LILQKPFNVTTFPADPSASEPHAPSQRVYFTVGPLWDPLTISRECRTEADVDEEYTRLLEELRRARDRAKAALRSAAR
jgi:hypothetical protein